MINIAYLAGDHGGCTYYRAMLPLDMLFDQKLADVVRLERGGDADRASTAMAHADVMVCPRSAGNEQMLKLLDEFRSDNKLVVADYDDNIWAVNPLSPHYADYGMKDYQHTMLDGTKVWVWKDGVNGFSARENLKKLNAVKAALQKAHVLTTTTEILAAEFRRFHPNVVVLPNCVDLHRWRKLPLKPHDEFRLFWAGGSSHFEDWQILAPVLPVILQRFPRVKLVLVGFKWDGLLRELPANRIEFHPWENNESYPLRCATLAADLCIIPLADNLFNRCKSPIKWVEQSALEVPCVMSHIGPYAEVYNGGNAVMVKDNDRDAWIEAISYMIKEPVKRLMIAGEARRCVEANFDIEKRAKDWLTVYEAAFEKVGKKVGAAVCQ